MIPPKTLTVLRSSRRLKRFRDCPRLATLPYATYGNAHQIKLAAEILGAALYWRSERFRTLKRSSRVNSAVKSTVNLKSTSIAPPPDLTPPPSLPDPTIIETPGEE